MFKNYLRMAFRNFTGNLLYSGINVVGLGIGLACCLLIMLFVRNETSFDKGFANADRVYRISREYLPFEGARARVPAQTNAPMAPALAQDFADIELAGRISAGDLTLQKDEMKFLEPHLRVADNAILQIFDFEWLAGDATQALVRPDAIVLTESLARKYFGTTDVLGQRLKVMDRLDVEVTGVIRDLPANTHLQLSGMLSMNVIPVAFGANALESWNSNTDYHTYVLLKQGASIANVESGFPAFLERHAGEGTSKISLLRSMNIQDIHLHSDRDEEWKALGNMTTVYSFSAIAVAILLIACINFMSIATARASQRAKEVGMRKSMGATRGQLIGQFLGESLATSLLAMMIALALVELLLSTFSVFAGSPLRFNYMTEGPMLGVLIALTVAVAFIAGSYPAMYLSAFQPATVLKGDLTRGNSGLRFRNVLIVVQFSIAIVLVIATAVIYLQRDFANRFDLGFNKDNVVVVTSPAPQGYREDWPAFKQELLGNAAVEGVTASHYLPFGFNDNQIPVQLNGSSQAPRIQYMMVDYDFFETYQIDLLAGRSFEPARGTDATSEGAEAPKLNAILNAAAVRALGLDNDSAISSVAKLAGRIDATVTGVVADTYFETIRNNMRPLIYLLVPPQSEQPGQQFRNAAIRVNAAAVPQALAHIEATFNRHYPGQSLSLHFLDDDCQAMYHAEEQQAKLFSWFAALSILIACFGLFGLASFNAARRTKEIGVRKVMGGSVMSIVLLLTNDFSKLVLLANAVAWPVAYYAMNRWLENFAYRMDLTPLVFIGSGLIALCIAWVTVGSTAAKAASQKPVLALRYE